jgi:hypothetical protein
MPFVKNIKNLIVNSIGDTRIRTLSKSSHLKNLQELNLNGNCIGEKGFLLLAKS